MPAQVSLKGSKSSSKGKFMSKFFLLLLFTVLGCIAYIFWPQISMLSYGMFVGKEFKTLERQISAEEIMQREKEKLLKTSQYTFAPPKLIYSPYLLLEVKYSKGKSETEESLLLWSLGDGEMVVNTMGWEKTSGFADCLDACATKNDFEILKAVAQEGGKKKRELLFRKFDKEDEIIEKWISSSLRKKLIVEEGSSLRLHLAKPHLVFTPKTAGALALVTRPLEEMGQKEKAVYTPAQIKRLCQNAFGTPLCIRNEYLIYLPVYEITVQNPDGSFFTTIWNAFEIKVDTEVNKHPIP